MTAKIQVRRDTTANWNAGTPPTLAAGEIGLDTDLKQIKIGDNTNNWTALPWLAGTLPSYTSPNTDLNNATNSLQGVYRFSNGSALTNAPAAPIDIKAADGGVSMLVLKHGTTVVQQLWTDGDTTVTPKSYSRVYDGDVSTWRAWIPQSTWGISATEGVDVVAKSITLKDTGTGLTVDGNSTLTGNVTVNGTTTLGNANSDIVVVQAGTASNPIITTSSDTNTGVYFPSADNIALTAAGVQQLLLNGTVASAASAVFNAGATFNNIVDMNLNRVIDIGAPVMGSNDACRISDLAGLIVFGNRFSNGSSDFGSSSGHPNNTTISVTGMNTATITITPAAGSWVGLAIGYGATGNLQGISFRQFSSPMTNGSPHSITGAATQTGLFYMYIRVG